MMHALDVGWGIRSAASLRPNKIALQDSDRSLTFGKLVERINRVSNGARHGLRLEIGRCVGVLAPNCIEFIELLIGLSGAGSPPVLLNSRSSAAELRNVCADSGLRAIFVHPTLRGLCETLGLGTDVELIELGTAYEHWLGRASCVEHDLIAGNESLLCMPFTGGTTGRAKGVMLSHRSRTLMYLMMASVFGCYTHADRNLTISPLFHGAGFNFSLATLYFGGSVVLAAQFDPEEVLRTIARERITNLSMVPTHLSAIFGLSESSLERAGNDTIRSVISNGAPLSLAQKHRAIGLWGASSLFDAYGSTEAGIVSVLKPDDQLKKPTSSGEVFPGTMLRIVADGGNEVPTGEIGEVLTRSPYLFSGYHSRQSTAPTPASDWYSTGDIGYLDEDNHLHLVDRKGEMIVSGGMNVYPSEVEAAIAAHPAVSGVAAFGVADSYWGEAVHAVIATVPGANLSDGELREFAARRLARFKVPKSFTIVDELPMSAAGKILRRQLRDRFKVRRPDGESQT